MPQSPSHLVLNQGATMRVLRAVGRVSAGLALYVAAMTGGLAHEISAPVVKVQGHYSTEPDELHRIR